MPPSRPTADALPSSSPPQRNGGPVAQRAPRRCKKCPGPPFPLEKECVVHSKRAAARAKKNSPPATTDVHLPTGGHSTPVGTLVGPEPQRTGDPNVPLLLPTTSPLPVGATATSATTVPLPPATPAPLAPPSAPSFMEPLTRAAEPQALTEELFLSTRPTSCDPFGLDPQDEDHGSLDGPSHDFDRESSRPPPDLSSQEPLPTDLLLAAGSPSSAHFPSTPSRSSQRSSSPVSSSTPSTPSNSRRARLSRTYLNGQRQRACNSRPFFGKMTIKRGTKPMEIVRTGSLTGLTSPKSINRKFVRKVENLLLSAERLADETDCWLHIATSHPSVKGECYHWMSPTMEDDLPPDVRDHLNTQTVQIFSTLKKVRRHDVAAIEMEATQYRTKRDDAVRARDEAQGLADQRQTIIDRLGEHMRSQGLDITRILEGSQV